MDTSTEHGYPNEIVKTGDLVLIHIDEKRRFIRKIEPDLVLYTDFGIIRYDDIVGKSYGYCLDLTSGKKACILKPLLIDVEDKAYRRITQVIYPKDIGFMITASLPIRICKASIVEVGVGSGFLASHLALTYGRDSIVVGLEAREDIARVLYNNLALGNLLDYYNLIVAFFPEAPLRESIADILFIDIADSWRHVDQIYGLLKPSGVVIAFAPTINQAEKLVLGMQRHGGFIDEKVYEILLREYVVRDNATRPRTWMIGHTGYIIMGRKILLL